MTANAPAVEVGPRTLEGVTAAVVGRERASAQATVRALQTLVQAKGEQELFKAEAEEKLDEKQPNFTEIEATLNTIPNVNRRNELRTRANLMQEIVERRNPGTIEAGATPDAHIQMVSKVAANMPGLVAAISKETGLPILNIQTLLNNANMTRGSAVGRILDRLSHDPNFVKVLRTNVALVEQPEEAVGLNEQIRATEDQINSKQRSIDTERSIYTNAAGTGSYDSIDNLKRANPAAFNILKSQVDTYNQKQTSIKNNTTLSALGISSYIANNADAAALQGNIDASVNRLTAGAPAAYRMINVAAGIHPAPVAGADPLAGVRVQLAELVRAHSDATVISGLYGGANFDTDMRNINLYNEYLNTKRGALDNDQDQLNTKRVELVKQRTKRDRLLNDYGNKVDRVLSKSVKDYYNTAVLAEADRIAQYEAQKKAEDKKAQETEKEKRETTVKEIMDKYLLLSFLKYKNGKVDGWDDKGLKDFVKKDMLSRSPAQLAKDFAQRINTKRLSMPRQYAAEMKKMMADMGVTMGPPPVSFNDILNGIDQSKFEKWSEEKVPDMLGYAYARGYYFDRLKITPAQSEFLRRAYPNIDFFDNAIKAKGKYAEEATKMLGYDLFTAGAVSKEKLKKLFGNDWVDGSKRVMKTLAVAGAIGAGAFALTGGLGSGLALNLLDPASVGAFLSEGAAISGGHIADTISAGTATVRLASKASGAALGAVTGHLVPPTLDGFGNVITPAKPVGGIQEVAQNIYNTIDTLENPKP